MRLGGTLKGMRFDVTAHDDSSGSPTGADEDALA
jgi:hypothetical protein